MIPEEKQKLTLKEIQAIEYKKCSQDPVYFMRKFVKVQHQLRGKVLFNLYPFQEDTLRQFANNKFNIVLKSRQMGISTLCAAYILWVMLFNKDKNILIISIKQDTSKELVSKIKLANDNLPIWLKVKCVENNMLSLKFENGSNVRAVSSSSDAGRSMAVYLLVIDEAAFIEGISDIWASAWSTLSTGGNAILLSTPNGIGNFFHKMWVDAETKTNSFNPIKLKWDLHPERTQTWRDAQTKELGAALAGQECDTDFLASGHNVIATDIIDFYKKTYRETPAECRELDKALWIWKYPDYNSTYIISADTSRGDGGDYQACHVLDAVTLEQCAEYKGQISTKEFGNLLCSLGAYYNNSLLVIERENTGWAVIQQVIDREYPNLFYMTKDLKYVDPDAPQSNNIYSEEKKAVAGFSTTMKTRPIIIDNFIRYMSEKELKIRSSRTLAELETFIWKNFKAQAMQGYNDDLIISLCIGLWIRDTALKLRQQGIDLTRASLSHINRTQLDTTPVFKAQARDLAQQSWQMSTGKSPNRPLDRSNQEDLKWLLE